ncbi:hypothetical protein TNCV_778161 [Trichonephila clavipes]|nr:hypothetical protein TNCV_778161 [Trichonephila clavipes]
MHRKSNNTQSTNNEVDTRIKSVEEQIGADSLDGSGTTHSAVRNRKFLSFRIYRDSDLWPLPGELIDNAPRIKRIDVRHINCIVDAGLGVAERLSLLAHN